MLGDWRGREEDQSCFGRLPAVTLDNHLSSLCPGFLTYKIKMMIIVLYLQGCC